MAAACTLPKISNMSTASITLMKIRQRVNKKWLLIAIFSIIASFLVYMIYTNIVTIKDTYKQYVDNLEEKKQAIANNPISSTNDNEIYEYETKVKSDIPSEWNTAIKSSIGKIKSDYKNFNKALQEQKPGTKDIIDEKMLASEYDNY